MWGYVYLQADSKGEGVRMMPFPPDAQSGRMNLSTAAREFVPAVKKQQPARSADEPKEPLPSKEVTITCPCPQKGLPLLSTLLFCDYALLLPVCVKYFP